MRLRRKRGFLSVLFLIVLLLLLSWQKGTAEQATQRGDFTGSITFGGLDRTYRIHIPSSYDKNSPVSLVIVLHGGGGTGEKMEELTLRGFNRLSDKEGFIVVYPDGIEKHWNDGRKNVRYRAHREKIDDVRFISSLIDDLIQTQNIDKRHIYATGISNGAMMSFRLACELSEKIAAIAPVSGAMPKDLVCSPSRPVSVLVISNKEDPMVPWAGGEIRFGRQRFGEVLSVNESVRLWVHHNQCSSSPTNLLEPDKDPQDGTRVRREEYGQGKGGTEVILYAIEGGGHTWPGGHQYLPAWIIGKTSRDIDADEVIWNFFKKHPTK